MSDNNIKEKRKYERFSVDFEILVSSYQPDDAKQIDNTTVEDISGGGVSFYTNLPEQYHVGQLLDIAIHLPDCEAYNAYMRSLATVVRINKATDESQAIVGLQIEDELSFESTPKAITNPFEYTGNTTED